MTASNPVRTAGTEIRIEGMNKLHGSFHAAENERTRQFLSQILNH